MTSRGGASQSAHEATNRRDRGAALQGPPQSAISPAPRMTLTDVLARLGPGLLVPSVAGSALDRCVTEVVVHDPLVPNSALQDAVLLGVGVDPSSPQAIDLLHSAGSLGYTAVVLHASRALSRNLILTAERAGIVLLTSPADVPWAHLGSMLRISIGSGHLDEIGGVALGDLFGFTETLATDLAAAVTVEDSQFRVMAYSGVDVGDDVDIPRKETILGRQVPPRYTRLLREKGVLRRLLYSDEVVHVEEVPEVGLHERFAVSVRVGGEVLGSIWVAEPTRPLVADFENLLREASQTAAFHILRFRLDLANGSRLRQSVLHELLDGTAVADMAARRLGLRQGAPYAVLAFEAIGDTTLPARLHQVVDLYCSTFRPGSMTAVDGLRAHAVIALQPHDVGGLRRFATEAAARVSSSLRQQVLVGVGPVVTTSDRLVASRRSSDRVMRVLLREGSGRVVAELDDVLTASNLLEVLEVLRERRHLQEGRLTRLREVGNGRDQVLLATLRSYLDSAGDVKAAAAALGIPQNTFRYRLRRAVELTGIDLDDPHERLMTHLQLLID
jgi:PucR C-terminal helix-turn-helix domain/GGDEF-like domain